MVARHRNTVLHVDEEYGAVLGEVEEMYTGALSELDEYRVRAYRRLSEGLLHAAQRTMQLVALTASLAWWRGAVTRKVAAKTAALVRMHRVISGVQKDKSRTLYAFHRWVSLYSHWAA